MIHTFIQTALANSEKISILPRSESSLADKLRSGNIQLSDLPAFIASFIETGILLAGIISFLMILVGGYQYIIGGVFSDMREQGKNTLIYAISGFVLSMMAYGIVTLVQLAATSLT